MELQYVRLKGNFNKDKQPYLSKFTLPVRDKIPKEQGHEKSTISLSVDEIKKQMKKPIIGPDGRKVFPDLELIRKGRAKRMKEIAEGKKSAMEEESEHFSEEEQKIMLKKSIVVI